MLAGGTTSFAGTRVRILAEIRKCYRDTHANEGLVPITVNDMAARQFSVAGGSLCCRGRPCSALVSVEAGIRRTRAAYHSLQKLVEKLKNQFFLSISVGNEEGVFAQVAQTGLIPLFVTVYRCRCVG